ncbi:MAG TPA: hypothetical protein VFA40_13770 [Terriglobales bacterium]|jgi:hypothetical protein|nr:hypothetical protein [Terriglobales bacterium]
MTTPREDSNWVSIAEQLSIEMDDAKLTILVQRLCCALDARYGPRKDETKRDIEQLAASCSVMIKVPLGTETNMG